MNHLIVGLGGLGSSVVQSIYKSGCVKELHLLDMDKVELVNLSTQFLYDARQVGKHKAVAMADKLREIGCTFPVHPHAVDFEDLEDASLFLNADVVICALDSYQARLSLDYRVRSICRPTDKALLYIDCGVEGYRAHLFFSRVPGRGPCMYCLRGLFVNAPLSRSKPVRLCSVRNVESLRKKATNETKDNLLVALLEEFYEGSETPADKDEVYRRTSRFFNEEIAVEGSGISAVDHLYVMSLDRRIVPNVSYVNSVVGALAGILVKKAFYGDTGLLESKNFLYYSGERAPYFCLQALSRDARCLVCREPPPE